MGIIGYTAGAFDMFHIGHLNLLERAKKECDYLIVAVSSDELVFEYKGKMPMIPLEERMKIVAAICHVDKVVIQTSRDKKKAFDDYQFDKMFVGSDWKNDVLFESVDAYMKKKGAFGVVYLPYTEGISSTRLRDRVQSND